MLPKETLAAMLPPSAKCGKLVLKPMAAIHAVILESLGISLDHISIPEDKALIAAFVLSSDDDELEWAARLGELTSMFADWSKKNRALKNSDVHKAVEFVVGNSFSTYVPGANPDGENRVTVKSDNLPEGYGWPLEISEFLAAEYSMSMHDAMRIPFVQAFGMIACARIRNDGKAGGPDYYHKDEMARFTALIKAQKSK